MSQPPVRIGVVGCGAVARAQHLPVLRKLAAATVVAVADPDPDARSRAARLAPGAAQHAGAEELLAREEVDAVVVTAPPARHAVIACAAAAAGKHVYVEKPLATTEADGVRTVEAVTGAGVIGVIGFNRRSHPVYVRARELVRSGAIGSVRFVNSTFCEPVGEGGTSEWKRSRAGGGGVLLELASHHFDLLRWFLDTEIDVVAARTAAGWSEQDDALLELSTSSGAEGQGLYSFRAAHADFLELFGETGRLRVDRHRGALVVHRRRRNRYGIRRAWGPAAVHALTWQVRRPVSFRGDPSYGLALARFVERVAGAEREAPSLEDGLRSLQAVLAAERLAATGA